LFAAADHLAGGSAPSIVINGGRLALAEARARLDGSHLVVVVGGSGRAADELASDVALLASGRLRVISLDVDEAGIAAALGGEPGRERGMDR
jgi:SLOG in TRPM, prokaryote